MTATVLYTVWCNGKHEDGSGDCGAWITGDTAWEARDDARSQGWTCGRNLNSRDLCPTHAAAAGGDRG
jgi:hypothetical protein